MSASRVDALVRRFGVSEGRVVVDGEVLDIPSPPNPDGVGEPTEADALTSALSDAIYRDAYARLPPGASTLPDAAERERDERFVDAVLAAHCTAERWDAGWRLDAVAPHGHVSVARDADWRHAAPGDFRTDPAGRGAVPGARVALLVRPFDLESQAGSIYLHGETLDDRASGAWLGRLYFNADPETTVRLVDVFSRQLDTRRIPFTLKCPAHVRYCARVDSVVLYVAVRHLDALFELLGRELRDAASPLRELADGTPLFTRELATGVGFAEDPGAGHSFGTHRSRLVAEALLAHAGTRAKDGSRASADKDGHDAWRACLDATFSAAGLDPARPWLAPGSIERFSLDSPIGKAVGSGSAASSRERVEVDPDSVPGKCRAEASRIAMTLCRDAIWSDGCCNWMGWNLLTQGEQLVERHAATGASLYDGAAGIALFLAHVACHDDEPLIVDTLTGALRGLAPRVEHLRAARDGGVYTGLAGVAFALHDIAAVREDGTLSDEADALLDEAVAFAAVDDAPIDVLTGVAGLLPLLLDRGGEKHLEQALRLAERLLERARSVPAGIEWPTGAGADAIPLTGFSHGAAGIAWSLAEVGVASASPALVEAARATMRAENASFSESLGNWPDFRDADPSGSAMAGRGAATAPTAMSAWCHGAPGIGLARLRTAALLDDESARADARIALDHVLATLSHDLRTVPHGLCHGLCGNLELLLEASRDSAGGERWRRPLDATLDTLLDAVRLGHPWVGGTRSGRQTPGLMLGLAGIGHFLLRCAHPESESRSVRPRSVLLMTPALHPVIHA